MKISPEKKKTRFKSEEGTKTSQIGSISRFPRAGQRLSFLNRKEHVGLIITSSLNITETFQGFFVLTCPPYNMEMGCIHQLYSLFSTCEMWIAF